MVRRHSEANPLKCLLSKKQSGIGGLYFITVSIICSFIMSLSLQLSWDSQVVAMADNISHIVAMNTIANNYLSDQPTYTNKSNPSIPTQSGDTYKPLEDFNSMIIDAGIATEGTDTCKVTWYKDSKQLTLQMGSFKTILGSEIRPHGQKSIIESY